MGFLFVRYLVIIFLISYSLQLRAEYLTLDSHIDIPFDYMINPEHDPGNAVAALTALHEAESSQKHVTGLLYFDNSKPALAEDLGLVDTPLIDVPDDELRPSKAILDELNAALLG